MFHRVARKKSSSQSIYYVYYAYSNKSSDFRAQIHNIYMRPMRFQSKSEFSHIVYNKHAENTPMDGLFSCYYLYTLTILQAVYVYQWL